MSGRRPSSWALAGVGRRPPALRAAQPGGGLWQEGRWESRGPRGGAPRTGLVRGSAGAGRRGLVQRLGGWAGSRGFGSAPESFRPVRVPRAPCPRPSIPTHVHESSRTGSFRHSRVFFSWVQDPRRKWGGHPPNRRSLSRARRVRHSVPDRAEPDTQLFGVRCLWPLDEPERKFSKAKGGVLVFFGEKKLELRKGNEVAGRQTRWN